MYKRIAIPAFALLICSLSFAQVKKPTPPKAPKPPAIALANHIPDSIQLKEPPPPPPPPVVAAPPLPPPPPPKNKTKSSREN